MLTISVNVDMDATVRHLAGLQKQVTYAAARALTATAKQAALDVQAKLPEVLDRPTPFTIRSVAWQYANKQTLTSAVYFRPIAAAYIAPLITGETVRPKKRALLVPENIKLDRYGNMSRNAIRNLIKRKDVFSGTVKGVPGLWQRYGRKVRLLVAYEPLQRKPKKFPFARIVQSSVEREWRRQFAAAWSTAMATAR